MTYYDKGAMISLRHIVLWVSFSFAVGSSPSPISLTSVSALDKFGKSVQLQHAREAAFRHGTLVVATRSTKDKTVVVASIHGAKKPGIISHPQMVNALAPGMYLACSGIKADSKWFLEKLLDYQKRQWDVYDRYASPDKLKPVISQIFLQFMGYERKKELTDMMIFDKKNDIWGRPMGVMSLLLTPTSISLIDPSGIIQEQLAYAIGKDSDQVNDELEKVLEPEMTTKEVKDMLKSMLTMSFKGKTLLIETISAQGVTRETKTVES